MIWTSLLPIINTVLGKVLPDKVNDHKAAMEVLTSLNDHEIKLIDAQLSAIVAEARSKDKFTSRARPSFLYVIYVYLLSAIPMGILFAFNPEIAQDIGLGLQIWLNAIPEEIYTLFGVGYLGYTGARSYDKHQQLKSFGASSDFNMLVKNFK